MCDDHLESWSFGNIFIDRVIFMTYHCNPKNESGMVNLATDYLFLIRFLL